MLYLETLPAKLDSKTKYYTTKHNQRSKIKIRIWTKPQINVKRDSRKILKFNIKRDSRKILKFNIKRDSRKILNYDFCAEPGFHALDGIHFSFSTQKWIFFRAEIIHDDLQKLEIRTHTLRDTHPVTPIEPEQQQKIPVGGEPASRRRTQAH